MMAFSIYVVDIFNVANSTKYILKNTGCKNVCIQIKQL